MLIKLTNTTWSDKFKDLKELRDSELLILLFVLLHSVTVDGKKEFRKYV